MKFKVTSLLFLIGAVLIAGCMKGGVKGDPNVDLNVPAGTFAGTFELVHKSSKTGKTDTTYAPVVVVLGADFTYNLTGDTTTIQQYCHGTFTLDQADGLMMFTDQTAKNYTLNAPKKHLSGTYIYNYASPNLQIYGSSDTLYFNYTLIKS